MRYTLTRIASRPCKAIQLYSAVHYTAVQRYTLYKFYNTPLGGTVKSTLHTTERGGVLLFRSTGESCYR